MKTIRVFIASSEELRLERLEFTDMIQQLNLILKHRGIEIEPVKWEYLDASMGALHKQEEYNKELKSCEICLVLYWTRFGDYTKSELDTAYSELCAGRNPRKLYIYFKDADEISPELKSFKENFSTEYGHFFCRFENVDTMKLNFLLQFEAYQNKNNEVLLNVRESFVEIDGHSFINLKKIPFAGNNPEYLQLIKQIEKAQERVLKYPDEIEFRQELHDLKNVQKTMETSLLDTARDIVRLSSITTSERLARAISLFESGDNKGANAVLDFDIISQDAHNNVVRLHTLRQIENEIVEAIETNIEEFKLKIKTIQNAMLPGWVDEIIKIYDKAISIGRNNISDNKFVELLSNYSEFILNNKQYHLVSKLYDECLNIIKRNPKEESIDYKIKIANVLNNVGSIYYSCKCYDLAEDTLNTALKYRRELLKLKTQKYEETKYEDCIFMNLETGMLEFSEEKSLEMFEESQRKEKINLLAYEVDVVSTLINLGNLYSDIEQYKIAENRFGEALEITRRIVIKNPDIYENLLVINLVNLSRLHLFNNQIEVSEKEFLEALDVAMRIVKNNPGNYEPLLANVLNNLGFLYIDKEQFDLAEEYLNESLKINRQLAEKNPYAYNDDVATILRNIGDLYLKKGEKDLAEKTFNDALEIIRPLFEKNPTAYESKLTLILSDLGFMYIDNGQLDLSEKMFNEILNIYRELIRDSNTNLYDSNLNNVLEVLAILNFEKKQLQLAEQYYNEALEISMRLAQKDPDNYECKVALYLKCLGDLQLENKNLEQAKKEYESSLEVYKKLLDNNPGEYEEEITEIFDILNKLPNVN